MGSLTLLVNLPDFIPQADLQFLEPHVGNTILFQVKHLFCPLNNPIYNLVLIFLYNTGPNIQQAELHRMWPFYFSISHLQFPFQEISEVALKNRNNQ